MKARKTWSCAPFSLAGAKNRSQYLDLLIARISALDRPQPAVSDVHAAAQCD
jgi:hypothetical protein